MSLDTLNLEGSPDAEMARNKIVDLRVKLPKHPSRKWKKRKLRKIKYIIVHSTFSDNQDPFKTARYHITPHRKNHISKKGCPAIVYHDYISSDGVIHRCNEYTDWTWHAGWINRWSLGVAMAFNGQHIPPVLQYQAMLRHVTKLALILGVNPKRIKGHREVSGFFFHNKGGKTIYKTMCPGMWIGLDSMRKEVSRRMQRILASRGLYQGKIDGLWGRLSKKAHKQYQKQFKGLLLGW